MSLEGPMDTHMISVNPILLARLLLFLEGPVDGRSH